jgi:hypothetical protein
MFENRVLRSIFGTKRDEIIGGWRKMHNEELHKLYLSPNIVMMTRKVRWSWHIAYVVAEGNAYRILVGNLKEVNYF